MITRHIATYAGTQGWQERQRRAQLSVELERLRQLTEDSPSQRYLNASRVASVVNSSNVPRNSSEFDRNSNNDIAIEMVESMDMPVPRNSQQSTRSEKKLPPIEDLPIQEQIFLALEKPNSSKMAFIVNLVILVIVLLSIITFLVSSMAEYWHNPPTILRDLDLACGSVFLIEYLLKLCSAPKWKEWIRKPESIIDWLAILPLFIEVFVSFSGGTQAVRLVRLLRLFRILKLAKFSHTLSIVGNTILRAKDALFLLVFLVTVSLLVSASLMFYAEQAEQTFDVERQKWIRPDGSVSPFQSIPETFWWSVVTLTTTGYGDQYPITWPGRIIATLTMLSGIFAIAFPVTIVNTHFQQIWEEFRMKKEMKESESVKKDEEEWTTQETMLLLKERNMYMLEHLSSMDKQLQWYQFEIQQMGVILEALYDKFQKSPEVPRNKDSEV